jgi:hypothetical protein
MSVPASGRDQQQTPSLAVECRLVLIASNDSRHELVLAAQMEAVRALLASVTGRP